ncbi:hypothetical protein PATA110615_29920 [Paenibacillus taichungensis]
MIYTIFQYDYYTPFFVCMVGRTSMIPNEEGVFLSRNEKNIRFPYSHKVFKLICSCES